MSIAIKTPVQYAIASNPEIKQPAPLQWNAGKLFGGEGCWIVAGGVDCALDGHWGAVGLSDMTIIIQLR